MNSRSDVQSSVRRWRELLASERDAAALYSRLAEAETGERQQIFRDLAAIELEHAAHWESKLRSAGAEVPTAGGPSLRTRLLGATAGRLSVVKGSRFQQRELPRSAQAGSSTLLGNGSTNGDRGTPPRRARWPAAHASVLPTPEHRSVIS